MGEEFLGVTSVFAGDLIGFFEDAKGAEGDVLKIADGSTDEIEAAARIFEFGRHEGSLAREEVAPCKSGEKKRRERINTESTEGRAQRAQRRATQSEEPSLIQLLAGDEKGEPRSLRSVTRR